MRISDWSSDVCSSDLLGRRTEPQLAHRVDYPPLHGLEPVADEGQGAVEHHVHRVVEVGALGVLAQRDLLETVEGGADFGVGHAGEAWIGSDRTILPGACIGALASSNAKARGLFYPISILVVT